MTQDIVYNVTGQKVFLDCPEGQPDSVTSVAVFTMGSGDDSTAETAVGSPSVEGTIALVDADSGESRANPRILYLQQTTGIVAGRDYLLTKDSRHEWVRVESVDATAVTVTAAAPLANDYGSGDQLTSPRIQATVDSSWVADSGNLGSGGATPYYRVRWEYVKDSVTYVRYTYFDLVRAAGAHTVTPAAMESYLPGWLHLLPTDHRDDQGQRIIARAWQQVQIDLQIVNIGDQDIRDSGVLDELVARRAIAIWAESRVLASGADPITAERATAIYESRFRQLVGVEPKVMIADTTSGAGSEPTGISFFVR
jgi:hypothetical protein